MSVLKYICLVLGLVVSLNAGDVKHDSSSFTPIVPLSWLKANLDNPNLVIIDVRKESLFKKGHIKYAVNLPIFKTMFDKNYMMPKLDRLKDIFSNSGIDNQTLVVVYGNNQLIWAARFYWIGKVLGLKNIGILKVGYGSWKKGYIPTDTMVYKPAKKEFVPTVNNSIIQTKLSTLMSVGKSLIIDGRPKDFYMGKKSHAKRFGHIPTALNYPGSLNYEKTSSGSTMKDFNTLKKLYKKLPKDKDIVLYCEDGADAALNFLVLRQLGYRVSVYDGSWLEWGNDLNLPIANPSKKE